MLCGFKIPPLKICRIYFISACVGCTKEFLEIHRKNEKVVATFSHMAASWMPHACMAALLCRPLKVPLWATINGGKKVTMRHQPSLCSPCGCHLTTEKNRLENSFTKICWICFRKSPESLTKIWTCVDLPSPKKWCLPLYLLFPQKTTSLFLPFQVTSNLFPLSAENHPPSKPVSSHCPINWKKPKLSRPTRLFSYDIRLEWTSSFRTYLLTPNSDILEIEQNQLIEASSTPSTK